MKTFLSSLMDEYCSDSEQDSASEAAPSLTEAGIPSPSSAAPRYHAAEQFSLPGTQPPAETPGAAVVDIASLPPAAAGAGPTHGSVQVSEPKAPLLANAKPPFYTNQKEKPVHRAMLHLAAKGYNIKEISERVGRTPVCVNNILRQPMLQQTLVEEVRRVNGEDEQVVEVIKANVVAAVETLASIVKDGKQRASDRISAANALLERRYGKANQPINRNTDIDLNKLSDSELAKMLPATAATGTE